MKIFLVFFFLIGCGLSPERNEKVVQLPPTSTPTNKSFETVRPLIMEQCALSGCHAGSAFLSSGPAFKASRSAELIGNDRMPKRSSPNYDFWTDDKKAALLEYLRF